MTATPASPLAKRILAVIRRIGAGNGFEGPDVSLVSEENGRFTLHGSLALRLHVQRAQSSHPGRPAKAHVFASKKDLDDEIERASLELMRVPAVLEVAKDKIIDTPGCGFVGLEKDVKIPGLGYDFALVSQCPTCKGRGQGGCPVCNGQGRVMCPQCRGQREEWCGHCRGTGHANGQPGASNCTWCHGKGRMPCLRCTGHGQVPCQPCNGTGAAHCQTCLATGELAEVTQLTFSWQAQFLPMRQDTPVAVGHLIGSTSMDMLVHNGHITPKVDSGPHDHPYRDPASEDLPVAGRMDTLYWHVSADIPWCEAIVKLLDTSMVVTAAGLKGRVNHCPSFLDKRLAKAQRLAGEATAYVLRYSNLRAADRNLAKDYPVGLSDKARAHVLRQARARIAKKTSRTRIAAWLLSILLASVIGFLFKADLGLIIGFVVSVVVFHGLTLVGKLRFAQEADVDFKFKLQPGWELAILAFLAGFSAYIMPMVLAQIALFH